MKGLRYFAVLIYVIELTIISWCVNGRSLIGIDDANIYMVYMRNFANGHGFVFNIGGETVEGFTSLLWTLLGSLFYSVSSEPEILLLLTNILIVAYTLLRITNVLGDDKGDPFLNRKSLLFLAVIGITPGFIDWTVLSLMEGGLWCFLLTITFINIIEYKPYTSKARHYSVLGLLLSLLVFCRPESMLWVPVFIILNLIKEYSLSGTITLTLKWSLIPLVFFAGSLTILILWRLSYFGYPLPNTYYAKVSSSTFDNLISGSEYLLSLAWEKPFIVLILVHSAWFAVKIARNGELKNHLPFLFLIASVATTLFIPLCNGGDHFGLHRFIMPSIPLIVLLGILVINSSCYESRTILSLIVVSIFLSNSYNFREIWDGRFYPTKDDFKFAVLGRNFSLKLNDFFKNLEAMPSQGVLLAGGTAYSYQGKTIDLLGLNNTKMAHAERAKDRLLKNHASFNADVFFQLSPDIFWYLNTGFVASETFPDSKIRVAQDTWIGEVFRNIHLTDKFKENYGLYRISRIDQDVALLIFANKGFIKSLDAAIYRIYNIAYE